MSTSLQEQLKRLAVPQTIALADARSRASILFDRKEAATKTRRIIYDIGLSGLQELTALNPSFQQFELTLFDESALDLERAVEKSDVNRLLDRNIRKFFQHLSPYFLLRPAHLCLEWLLRRFQVHEYNRADLLALAFPYHATNTFVRVLQTVRIKQDDAEWGWLRPLQKAGVPVPKTAILNRAASDPAFLNFMCRATLDAISEMGPRAHLLQAQLNFYASVAVGALEHASAVQEWHISTLLPSLLKGLSSQVVDFVSAAFIVAAQLMTRTQLTPKLCNALLNRVAVVAFERLRQSSVLLLIWIFDTQTAAKPKLTDTTLLHLVKQKWLTTVLSTLAKDNVAVHALCEPLLQQAVAAIQSGHEEVAAFKLFLDRLLCDVDFPTTTAQHIIDSFLNAFVSPKGATRSSPPLNDGDVIELDSDDEMPEVGGDFQAWYADYLRKLERKYPTAFDMTLKEALKANVDEDDNRSKVLKMALGYRLKSLDANATDIYESLYHHTAHMRHYAVKTLLTNLADYRSRPQNYQLLKECLADRLADDSELVVEEVLRLPTEDFVNILGYERFVQTLFGILYKTQVDAEKWLPLTEPSVQHLTATQVVENYDTNLILLALMPLLFPDASKPTMHAGIAAILKSALPQKIVFLKELKLSNATKKGKNSDFSASEFKKQFLDVISSSKDTPTALSLFQSIDALQQADFFQQTSQLAHFLLLTTGCLKQQLSGAESLQIFERICSYCRRFRIKHVENETWQQVKSCENILPLPLYSDMLSALIARTHFGNLMNWEQPTEEVRCFLRIFSMLAREAFAQEQAQEKLEWTRLLKALFDAAFENPQAKIEFLTNFYIYADMKETLVEDYPALRLRAFKLLAAVIKNKENAYKLSTVHVLKITFAFNSHSAVMRQQALLTLQTVQASAKLDSHLSLFVDHLLERQQEISMDHEQFPLVLYTILKPAQKKQKQLMAAKVLREIMQLLDAEVALQNAAFTAEILKTLKHVNDEQMLQDLLPLAAQALCKTTQEDAVKLLPRPYSLIYQLICERFDSQNIENILIEQPAAWQFFEQIFGAYDVFLLLEGELQAVPCVALEALDEHIYDKMPSKYKFELIKLIIATVAAAENDALFLAANKLLKRCLLNCAPLIAIIERMYKNDADSKAKISKRKSINAASAAKQQPATPLQINSKSFREGVVLLELLENKKKLGSGEQLVPALFELLKYCLEYEQQSAVEYTKQLTLSTLFHCCQIATAEGINLPQVLPESTFRIDQIVQCVRATQNPQTQHNALLLLAHCASLYPQQVLHNIVDIFTFMGSSVVRHDDAFSFHVINNIIESIVPILVKGKQKATAEAVIPVLKVFSDILLDVPEHRRLPLYTKLLQTLGAEQYLWIFLCIVFEAHIIADEKQRLQQKKHSSSGTTAAAMAADKVSKRFEIALELTNAFAPTEVLETCIQLLHYIKSLPLQKDTGSSGKANSSAEITELTLFDVNTRSSKQLRHYKYTIMQFLSAISNAPEFLRKIALLAEHELVGIKPYYQNFIIKTLSYAPIINAAIEKSSDEPAQLKFWKVLLHHLHDVLDNAISLLSPDMFLVVVHGLMQHQLLGIRKKVIELLITKLQQRDAYFDGCDPQNFFNLLQPLGEIVCGILQPRAQDTIGDASSGTISSSCSTPSPQSSNEYVFLQQTALIAIKLLSKQFALAHIEEFKALLGNLIAITKRRTSISKILLATVILTMIEISSNLKAHSLAQLPKYMPLLIEVLQDQAELMRQQTPDNVCIAIITGIQKLFESLPLFLGPYIVDAITALSSIATRITAQKQEKDQRAAAALNKITTIWTKIATEVPVRILVPSCEKSYHKLMNAKNYADIAVLMRLLPEAIGQATSADLVSVQSELSNFFLYTLEFRLQVQSCTAERVAAIETVIIDAFVAWVLKLSESSFRPLYQKLYQWAFKQQASAENAPKQVALTYFLLTNKIAEALKSLFVLFAGDFIADAARLLNDCNTQKGAAQAEEDSIDNDLIRAILSTLFNVFLHDSKGFINTQRFELLMPPIVDQLENRLVLESETLQQHLSACIAQLAVTVSSDVLWKQLNYQVLLKTRTNVPEVRILSFNCCVEIARKLGEDFTPLLPETVPFIAELFEDENPRVEKNTRKSVQELEGILGESLQKYL